MVFHCEVEKISVTSNCHVAKRHQQSIVNSRNLSNQTCGVNFCRRSATLRNSTTALSQRKLLFCESDFRFRKFAPFSPKFCHEIGCVSCRPKLRNFSASTENNLVFEKKPKQDFLKNDQLHGNFRPRHRKGNFKKYFLLGGV